ncbi:MAG: TIGR03960 family B12-binding radical SAM protein [Clostridia bacterium]|nr:TIGR03960 family B12-binding radical SAM protein [Clostridia bacterium]
MKNVTEKLDSMLKKVEKPARYTGGELNSVVKNPAEAELHMGFAFPDTYEIGMSYMGMQILYNLLNKEENIYCERIFSPNSDMEKLLREEEVELFTIETKTPISELDIIGFTLQYEMSYTNILNILDLGNIPLRSEDRETDCPLIVAGGPCAYNPEPLADIIDVFQIGDGEELMIEFAQMYADAKREGITKREFLERACKLKGIYVPSFYKPVYNEDGTIREIIKLYEGAPDRVERALVEDLNKAEFPTKPIVPFVETVHDRSVVETFRGCTRGCRFCQAGMIYRPVRERSKEEIIRICKEQLANTGHDELTLLSLSTSDYSQFEPLVGVLMPYCKNHNVSLSLPSLRLDNFSFKVLQEIQEYRKSGLTFAPEAGTQRLRDVINKNITEKDIFDAVEQAIELGWTHIKLYFMIGHPYETYEDLDGIADIASRVIAINKRLRAGGGAGRFSVTVSASNFVPKPFTPFQWAPQDTAESFVEKHNYLSSKLKPVKGVIFNYHDTETSGLEAVFARGDRRLGEVLISAFHNGCKFDSWTEHFNFEGWKKAFEETGIDPLFYSCRERSYDEVLPWSLIDGYISEEFLKSENEKAKKAITTPDCRHYCVGCGMNRHTTCTMGGYYGKIRD